MLINRAEFWIGRVSNRTLSMRFSGHGAENANLFIPIEFVGGSTFRLPWPKVNHVKFKAAVGGRAEAIVKNSTKWSSVIDSV